MITLEDTSGNKLMALSRRMLNNHLGYDILDTAESHMLFVSCILLYYLLVVADFVTIINTANCDKVTHYK